MQRSKSKLGTLRAAGGGECTPCWICASAACRLSDSHSLVFILLPPGTFHRSVTITSRGCVYQCTGMVPLLRRVFEQSYWPAGAQSGPIGGGPHGMALLHKTQYVCLSFAAWVLPPWSFWLPVSRVKTLWKIFKNHFCHYSSYNYVFFVGEPSRF